MKFNLVRVVYVNSNFIAGSINGTDSNHFNRFGSGKYSTPNLFSNKFEISSNSVGLLDLKFGSSWALQNWVVFQIVIPYLD